CRSNPLCWRLTRRTCRRPGSANPAGRDHAMSRLTLAASPGNWPGCAALKSMKLSRLPDAMRTRFCRGSQSDMSDSVDLESGALHDPGPCFLLGYQQVRQLLPAGPHHRETGVLQCGPDLLIIQ